MKYGVGPAVADEELEEEDEDDEDDDDAEDSEEELCVLEAVDVGSLLLVPDWPGCEVDWKTEVNTLPAEFLPVLVMLRLIVFGYQYCWSCQ
jgi:hypothetical protein